jgi:hypothetical protein
MRRTDADEASLVPDILSDLHRRVAFDAKDG